MASVDRNATNAVGKTTGVLASAEPGDVFDSEVVLVADAFPAFVHASQFPQGKQDLDAAYGRALNSGRGVVGEGGDRGPGIVGIAGSIIASPAKAKDGPRNLLRGPFPGRGIRAGVIGLGQGISNPDNDSQGETPKPGDAFGVIGMADRNVGVLGLSGAHAGVFGASGTTGVIGDGRNGQVGVEGVGSTWGMYGHVDFGNPNADGAGVFGAASMNFVGTKFDGTFTGRAGVFVGPVDVIGNLAVTGDSVVWGTKSAAARHDDGTHRLLYCVESPDSQFEDFGEAQLVNGKAEVRIDPEFCGLADTRHYHVFLTAYGDSQGLYVAARRRAGFLVREQGGGKSSLVFSYRLVARRKHTSTQRFAVVKAPVRPKIPAQPLAPEVKVEGKDGKRRRSAGSTNKA